MNDEDIKELLAVRDLVIYQIGEDLNELKTQITNLENFITNELNPKVNELSIEIGGS